MSYVNNVRVCIACLRSRGIECNGICPCPADTPDQQRTVIQHAEAGFCPENRFGEKQEPHGWSKLPIITGAIGVARAITGTGGASEEVIQRRTSICMACDHRIVIGGFLHQCKLCGCSTWAKVRNAEEHCPDNPPKW